MKMISQSIKHQNQNNSTKFKNKKKKKAKKLKNNSNSINPNYISIKEIRPCDQRRSQKQNQLKPKTNKSFVVINVVFAWIQSMRRTNSIKSQFNIA